MILNKLCPIIILIGTVSFNTSLAQEKFTKKVVKIGVTQSVSNSNFDADAKGFEKALAEAGFKEGTDLIYQRQNAKRNGVDAEKIAQRFLDDRVDLVHSIAPLASQAAVKKIRHLPIVFSSVTDPVSEGLVPKKSLPETRSGTNVTGMSDRWPVQVQFEMYVRFFPKAKKWGTIFNPGDPRSILHIQEMRATAKRLAIELSEATASSQSDTLKAAQALAGKVQAVIITFDSTVLSSFEVVVKVCNEKDSSLWEI
jgi:putative ABC transport system substrate-binding protein